MSPLFTLWQGNCHQYYFGPFLFFFSDEFCCHFLQQTALSFCPKNESGREKAIFYMLQQNCTPTAIESMKILEDLLKRSFQPFSSSPVSIESYSNLPKKFKMQNLPTSITRISIWPFCLSFVSRPDLCLPFRLSVIWTKFCLNWSKFHNIWPQISQILSEILLYS